MKVRNALLILGICFSTFSNAEVKSRALHVDVVKRHGLSLLGWTYTMQKYTGVYVKKDDAGNAQTYCLPLDKERKTTFGERYSLIRFGRHVINIEDHIANAHGICPSLFSVEIDANTYGTLSTADQVAYLAEYAGGEHWTSNHKKELSQDYVK